MFGSQSAIVGWKPWSDDPSVASARLRCRGPLALLRRRGFPVEAYDGRRARLYRAVVLQKLLDPEHQALARRLQAHGTRVVFDLCDNYLFEAGGDPELARRAQDARRMLDLADVVTVPTEALAERLPRAARVVRDGVEPPPLLRPPRAARALGRGGRPLELVWFGAWGRVGVPFGMRDLLLARAPLEALARRAPARLTVVSNSRAAYDEWVAPLDLPTRYVPWRGHAHLCRLLPRHDACLIPVAPNPYTLCKSPNRLALALSLGVPVVASSVPSYREFEAFCALDDWEGGLREVELGGPRLWARAEAGRRYVAERHSMARAADEWGRLLGELVGETARETTRRSCAASQGVES